MSIFLFSLIFLVLEIDYHYKRQGTRNISVPVEPKGGKHVVKATKRRIKKDYALYIHDLVAIHYSKAEKVHVVADNLNTHPLKCLKTILRDNCPIFDRLVLHFTPLCVSWLNQAELEIW